MREITSDLCFGTWERAQERRPGRTDRREFLTMLSLYSEENPHPPTCNFKEHENEETEFGFGEP